VKDLNSQTGEINLEVRGGVPLSRMLVISAGSEFRRYASGSIKFEDARPGSLADLKPGDQLRALGDKSVDGRTFKAEEIVSGAFRTVGAIVAAVDLVRGEIKASTLDQKKPIVISINRDSTIHRISPSLATTIAQRAAAGRSGNPGQSSPVPAAQKAAAAPSANQAVDVQQAIDALPNLSLTDIRTGDVVAITGAVEQDDSHVTAIKLVAGVDAVLKAMMPAPGKPQVVRLSAGLPAVFDFSVVQ